MDNIFCVEVFPTRLTAYININIHGATAEPAIYMYVYFGLQESPYQALQRVYTIFRLQKTDTFLTASQLLAEGITKC